VTRDCDAGGRARLDFTAESGKAIVRQQRHTSHVTCHTSHDTRHTPRSPSPANLVDSTQPITTQSASDPNSHAHDDDLQNADLHRLSRMVLQSLQFTDVSSSVTSDSVSTFSGSVALMQPSSPPSTATALARDTDWARRWGSDSYEA
jgi:hypothetical protein